MGPFDGMVKEPGFKPLQAKPQKILAVEQVKKPSPPARRFGGGAGVNDGRSTPISSLSNNSAKSSPSPASVNGPRPRSANGHVAHDRHLKRSTPSRPASKEPKDPVKHARAMANNKKRSSPAVSTPRFSSSDNEDEEDDDQHGSKPSKRPRVENKSAMSFDSRRRIRDLNSFSEDVLKLRKFRFVHAADVANIGTASNPNPKYTIFFTALAGDEDEAPTVELQYPSASQRERYQLIKSKESDDFKPIDEMINMIDTVAQNYLEQDEAAAINDEGTGIIQKLKRAHRRGARGEAGAQGAFIKALDEFNRTITALRKDGTIAKNLDAVRTLRLSFVETILAQIYARTVSPRITSLKAYENGTDNVYGELLPRFVSKIFKETKLKSEQVFVDLGSGVGNVVLQAALETGCESWGCEMMPNACDLAELQEREFPSRCRLWGLQPGSVHLERGDFLTNKPISDALKRADVVLINNQAFTPSLNDNLTMHFLDLKESCKIISLKSFVPHGHKIQTRNVDSPINVLTVEEKEYFSNSVSWTDAPGKWYLQRKDSRKLEAFLKNMV